MSAVPDTQVKLAEARAAVAKARLSATVGEIQRRLSPDELVRGAVDNVRERSAEFADDAVAAVIARPGTTAGAAAGLAAFALRRPIARVARRLFGRRNEN